MASISMPNRDNLERNTSIPNALIESAHLNLIGLLLSQTRLRMLLDWLKEVLRKE
jgi:hypothetical protein